MGFNSGFKGLRTAVACVMLHSVISNRIPPTYSTRRFITVFTTGRHLCLSRARRTQTTPCHPVSLISISVWSICAQVFKVFSFPQPIKSSPPHVKHAPPTSSPVISSPKYLKRSTNFVPPNYAIFSRLLLLPPHQAQVSPYLLHIRLKYLLISSTPYSRSPSSLCSSLNVRYQISHQNQTTATFLMRNHQCLVINHLKLINVPTGNNRRGLKEHEVEIT
jgi:hypothetical protein